MKPMHPAGPCNHCGTVSTPCWRSGPADKPHLCNACGSRWSAKRDLTGYFPGRRTSATGQKEELDSERYFHADDDDLPDVRTMFIPTRKRKRTRSLLDHPEHPNRTVVEPYNESPPRSLRTQVFVPIPERKEASTQTEPIKTQVVLVRAGPSNASSMTQHLPSILERLPSGMEEGQPRVYVPFESLRLCFEDILVKSAVQTLLSDTNDSLQEVLHTEFSNVRAGCSLLCNYPATPRECLSAPEFVMETDFLQTPALCRSTADVASAERTVHMTRNLAQVAVFMKHSIYVKTKISSMSCTDMQRMALSVKK